MSTVRLESVYKSFKDKDLLKDINLQVEPGEKLGLIGQNGAGKSTLLKLITGDLKADSGNIFIADNTVTAFLMQQPEDNLDYGQRVLYDSKSRELEEEMRRLELQMAEISSTEEREEVMRRYAEITARFEAADGYTAEQKLAKILSGLGLSQERFQSPVSELSGGEKMRVAIAEILAAEPDLMLLDEPTNHLDAAAVDWLEEFINSIKATVIIVSHDRYFLDRTVDKICELRNGRAEVKKGNYSDFIKQQQEEAAFTDSEIKILEKELERQKDVAMTLRSHRKISSWQSRLKTVAKLEDKLTDIKEKQNALKQNEIHIKKLSPEKIKSKNYILEIEDLAIRFSDMHENLLGPFDMHLYADSRICLWGPNGSGKSTLIKALYGESKDFTGEISLSNKLNFGILGQFTEFPEPELTVKEEIYRRYPDASEEFMRSFGACYGFKEHDLEKRLKVLSGGERARLELGFILEADPNLLFLDEPTNHLDIYSRDLLEKTLADYEGAIFAVSHDRYFIKNLELDVYAYTVENGIKKFVDRGKYEDYRRYKAKNAENFEIQSRQKNDTKSSHNKRPEPERKSEITEEIFNEADFEVCGKLRELQKLYNKAAKKENPNKSDIRKYNAMRNDCQTYLEAELERVESLTEKLTELFAGGDFEPGDVAEYDKAELEYEKLSEAYLKLPDLI